MDFFPKSRKNWNYWKTKVLFLHNKWQNPQTYRTAVMQNSVSESAVSLRFDLQVIGPFQNYSFFQVLSLVIHVPNTVFTKVSDILGSFLW